MKHFLNFFIVCTFLLTSELSLVAQVVSTVNPEEVGISSTRLNRIDAFVNNYISDGKISGAITIIARKGKVVHFKTNGLMDIESGKKMEPNTIFRIYSMTKPITTVALMMLYEEGHFQLDDLVSKYIPEFNDLKVLVSDEGTIRYEDLKRGITIKHLLTHTSGLAYGYEKSEVATIYKELRIGNRNESLKNTVDKLVQTPLFLQPGKEWHYSFATDVIGHLVEIISGESLSLFFKKRIFIPLKMVDTDFYVPNNKIDRLATMYSFSGDNNSLRVIDSPENSRYTKIPKFYSGGGGLVSTPTDYLRFAQMLLNGGELDGTSILGKKTVEMITMNHLPEELIPIQMPKRNSPYGSFGLDGYGFGFGLRVRVSVSDSNFLGSIGEYGWAGTAETYFFVDPKEELIGIFMTQFQPSRYYPLRREFTNLAYQSLID